MRLVISEISVQIYKVDMMAELVDAIQIVCGTLLISSLIMPVLLQPFESCRRGGLTG